MNLSRFGTHLCKGPALRFAVALSLTFVHPGCAHDQTSQHPGAGQEKALELSVLGIPDFMRVGQEASLWVDFKNTRKERIFFSDAAGVIHALHYADGSGYAGKHVTGPHECRDRLMNKHMLLPGESYYVAHEVIPTRPGKVKIQLRLNLEILEDDGSCSGTTMDVETERIIVLH